MSSHLTTGAWQRHSALPTDERRRAGAEPLPARPRVGDGLEAAGGAWSFSGDVCTVFEQHIRRSVPLYDRLHDFAVESAISVAGLGGVAYDLGCSTGALSRRLASRLSQSEVIGLDNERRMVEEARRLDDRACYVCTDIRTEPLAACRFVACCYTLQFLPLADRAPLIRKIYGSLQPGGALLLAEKVVRADPVFEQHCRAAHHAFKRSQSYSEAEIAAKARSIEGVLVPLLDTENVQMLKDAGFQSAHLILRHSCFDAWLAFR